MSEEITLGSEKITLNVDELTELISRAIRENTPPLVREDEELWNSRHCAAYLGLKSHVSFLEHAGSLPSFPSVINLPSARSKLRSGQLRWKACEVKAWALSHQAKK